MKLVKYSIFKTCLLGIWFALICILVYGSGVNLHYKIAPVLIIFSLLNFFIYSKGRIDNNFLMKIMAFFIGLSLLSSYHYFFNLLHRTSYLNYLCYSVTGYVIAITSYSIVRNDRKMLRIIYYLMIVFFVIGIFRFFRATTQLALLHANTAYYYILMPLPLLLLKPQQRIFHIVILLISTVLCVLSVKRGAMVSIAVVWGVYLIKIYKESKKHFVYLLLIMIIGACFLSEKIDITGFVESTERLEERFSTMDEDGGSGRVGIFEDFLKKDFQDIMKLPELFIGNGFEGTYYKYKDLTSMHNDFLEVIYTLGIIGFILLLRFYIKLYQRVRFLINNRSSLLVPYISMAFLFTIFSFIGCNFNYFHLSIPLFLSLGTLEAIRCQTI